MCFQVECANGQLGFGRRRRRDVASDGADVEQQRLYEVSMSTIIRFDEDESPLRAVTKREQVPSARQRQHLLVEKGTVQWLLIHKPPVAHSIAHKCNWAHIHQYLSIAR